MGGGVELQLLMSHAEEEGDVFLGHEAVDALRECLEKIEGPSRDLLNARYAVGKTVREIAKETGRGYSALTMQLHRLRSSLAGCIQQTLRE